jgi:hypothetical protein
MSLIRNMSVATMSVIIHCLMASSKRSAFLTDPVIWTAVTRAQSMYMMPDWKDKTTRSVVSGLFFSARVSRISRDDFPWLEIFVQGLCDLFGLENPFDDGNTVGQVALEEEKLLIPVNHEYLHV